VAFGVGLTRNPWVAGGLLALGGLCVVTFSVNLESLRQQLVPDRLLGRVISAFRLFSYGALPLGALVGGVLARSFGLPDPFVVAGLAIPVLTLLILPSSTLARSSTPSRPRRRTPPAQRRGDESIISRDDPLRSGRRAA
jgi:predicted MFS family arabinose efflux permease